MKRGVDHQDGPYGIPTSTLLALASEWLEPVLRGECSSVCYFPLRDQLRRISNILDLQNKLKSSLPYLKSHVFACLNLYTITSQNDKNWKKVITDIKKSSRRSVHIIMGADRLLADLAELSPIFESVWFEMKGRVSFIFLFTPNIAYEDTKKILGKYSIFYQRVSFFKVFSEIDMRHFVYYSAKFFGINLGEKVVNRISKHCGGYTWLVRQAVRYMSEGKDVRNIFSHDEMNLRINQVLSELHPDEKRYLVNICRKNEMTFDDSMYQIERNLHKVGYLRYQGKKPIVATPIVRDFIVNNFCLVKVERISGEWCVGGQVLSNMLTSKELAVIEILLDKAGAIVTREQVAKCVWGQNEDYLDYSDWALDRFVSRLRKKMIDVGLHEKWLKTVKGVGYLYSKK